MSGAAGGFARSDRIADSRLRKRLAARLALLASGLLLLAQPSHPSGGLYQVREVRPGVFVWIPEDILEDDGDPQYGRAGNAGFILAPDGVLVIGTTNNPYHARELLFEIRKRTDRPVKYVVDLDAGGDEVLGNEVFAEQRATLISTPAALAQMKSYQHDLARRAAADYRLEPRLRGFHLTFPTQTFNGEMNLSLGGQAIRVVHLAADVRPQAGEDAAVYLPEAKVLFLGDLFQNDFIPHLGTRDIRLWIGLLRQLEDWDVEVYVPGHGEPGGKKDLAAFRQFLEWLEGSVANALAHGENLEQVKTKLASSPNLRHRAPELGPSVLEAVFAQLSTTRQAAPASTADPRPTAVPSSPAAVSATSSHQ